MALVVTLAPASPAVGSDDAPWDAPGYGWQGTVSTQIDYTYKVMGQPQGQKISSSATYSELRPLGGNPGGDYDAHLSTTGTTQTDDWCYWTNTTITIQTTNWAAEWSGAAIEGATMSKLGLTTNELGQTYFAPWYQPHIPFEYKDYCTEDGEPVSGFLPAYHGTSQLGFE